MMNLTPGMKKLEMHYHQVFCFTPKWELIALPKGATALDFAFYVRCAVDPF